MQTRARGKSAPPPLPCRFEGCDAQLRSVAALRAHHRAHTGDTPWRCTEDGCTARFPARRALAAHVRETHSAQRDGASDAGPPPSLGALERVAAVDSDEKEGEEETGADVVMNEGTNEAELRKEAAEIANNCAYFATQLRAARGPAIAGWTEMDVQNAHGWATYVCDQLAEFADERAVSDALRAKKLSLRGMLGAERALFDSVLGFDALTPSTLSSLCASIATPRSEEALAAALAAAMRRKTALGTLCVSRDLLPVDASAQDVLREAAARVLRSAHSRNCGDAMRTHMSDLAKSTAGCELLLWEALLPEAGDEVAQSAVAAVLDACAADKEHVLVEMHPDVVTQACELSFPLFDRYVAHLLATCAVDNEGDSGVGRVIATPEVLEAEDRLLCLLGREGRVGHMTKALLRRYVVRAGTAASSVRLDRLLRAGAQ